MFGKKNAELMDADGKLTDIGKSALDYMKGIDFSKPVSQVAVGPKDVLVQFYNSRGVLGNFYTRLRGGSSVDKLGVSSENRRFSLWRPKSVMQALESYASSMKDTWTVKDKNFSAAGGGKQLMLQSNSNPGQYRGTNKAYGGDKLEPVLLTKKQADHISKNKNK
jgi:hypothetical protein